MILLILLVFMTFFLVIGVALILTGYKDIPSSSDIVSVKELNVAQSTLAESQSEVNTLKVRIDTLVKELEESRGNLSTFQSVQEKYEVLCRQEQAYQGNILQLEEEISRLSRKADLQAQEALTVIEDIESDKENLEHEHDELAQLKEKARQVSELTVQNEQLQVELDRQLSRMRNVEGSYGENQREVEQKVAEAADALEKLIEENARLSKEVTERTQALEARENELTLVKSEAEEKAFASIQAIEDLLTENNELQEHINERLGSINALQEELSSVKEALHQKNVSTTDTISTLVNDNAKLKEKVSSNEDLIKNLENELIESQQENLHTMEVADELKSKQPADGSDAPVARRKGDNVKVQEMRQTIDSLRQENKELIASQQDLEEHIQKMKALQEQLAHGGDVIDGEMPADVEALVREKAGLEEKLTKLKDYNSFLLEKEKIMQDELIKVHVQAVGYKKVFEDLKVNSG